MKTKLLLVLNFFLISHLLAFTVMADERLDIKTQTDLIQKLESVLELQNANEASDEMLANKSLTLRLADLYSERSRLLTVQLLTVQKDGKGNEKYKKLISKDQNRAIQLYRKHLPKMSPAEKARPHLQIAHLFFLQKKPSLAIQYLEEILESKPTEKIDPQYRAQAAMQLADLSFGKADFTKAEKLYTQALILTPVHNKNQKDYVSLRLAWCAFNQGKTDLAVIRMTKALEHSISVSGVENNAFAEEASKDLATFLAQRGLSAKDILTLKKLSPKNVLQSNLIYLAHELDRTAKKDQAILVWSQVDKKSITFLDQVERQIRLAKIQYDLGNQNQTVVEIKKSLALLTDRQCRSEADCGILQQSLRSLITDWGKAAERKPTPNLIATYDVYLQHFDDEEVAFWAGQAAMKTKQYAMAYRFYTLAIHSKALNKKIFEGSLVSSIEAAELSQDRPLHLQSLQTYLKLNPQGDKIDEVKYQIAHIHYETNQYDLALEEFYKISFDSKAPLSLRKKSSDLYFDILAIQKNDEKIETESLRFANVFAKVMPSQQDQFLALNRKSVLNQSASSLIDPSAEKSNYRKQLDKLNKISFATWPEDEKKKILQNKLLLAEKLQELGEVQNISQSLLKLKSLTAEEKDNLILKLAWVHEMRFEFAKSVGMLKKIQPKKNSADHLFKIILLSELAGQNPLHLYREIIGSSKKAQQRQYAAYKLIMASQKPDHPYQQYFQMIQSNPQLMKTATLYVFEKNKKNKLVQKAIQSKSIRNTFEAQLIARTSELENFRLIQNKISKLPRFSGSDSHMKNALNQRLTMIKSTEIFIQQAIRSRDLILQVAGLSLLYQQNKMLGQEIQNSKPPRGLNKDEILTYQAAIQKQASLYITQSKIIQNKALALWNLEEFQAESSQLQQMAVNQEMAGHKIALMNQSLLTRSGELLQFSRTDFEKNSLKRRKLQSQATQLKQQLNTNPFDYSTLAELKDLETALGSGPMVAYLNVRLSQSTKGGRN